MIGIVIVAGLALCGFSVFELKSEIGLNQILMTKEVRRIYNKRITGCVVGIFSGLLIAIVGLVLS